MPSKRADCICCSCLHAGLCSSLFLLFSLAPPPLHATLAWTVQVFGSAPYCCDVLICFCEDLCSLGTNTWGPIARAFHQQCHYCTSVCIGISEPFCAYAHFKFKFKLDLLHEGWLCSSATALATFASLGCCSTAASLQLLKLVKLERSRWECEWYLGFCGAWGEEIPSPGEKPYAEGPYSCDSFLIKGFVFSWRRKFNLIHISIDLITSSNFILIFSRNDRNCERCYNNCQNPTEYSWQHWCI